MCTGKEDFIEKLKTFYTFLDEKKYTKYLGKFFFFFICTIYKILGRTLNGSTTFNVSETASVWFYSCY